MKDTIDYFQKTVWLIGFGVTVRKISRVKIYIYKKIQKCKGWHLANGSWKPNKLQSFLKDLNKIAEMQLNVFPKLWLIFSGHQQKIQKWAVLDILITISLGVKMIIRQMCKLTNEQVFQIFPLSSTHWFVLFLHFKTFKIHGVNL